MDVVVPPAPAAAVAVAGRLGHERQTLVAAVRAAVQLAAVSVVIAAMRGSLPLTAVFVTAMYAVAARTSGRRMTDARSGWRGGVPVLAGSLPVVLRC